MKKILIYSTLLFALFSCGDEFITKDPLALQSDVTFYADAGNCELAVNAIYDPLGWESMYSRNMWAIGDIASDDAEKGGGNTPATYFSDPTDGFIGDVSVYNVDALNDVPATIWEGCYKGISRANMMLDRSEEYANGEDSATFKRLRGEARFLRAFYYFDLVKIFGPVPLVTGIISVEDAKNMGNRADGDNANGDKQVEEIYDFIISELEAIKTDLPWSYSADNFGRATRAAAEALLAKAYLFKGDVVSQSVDDYKKAYQTAKGLIDACEAGTAPYGLDPYYQEIFNMDLQNEDSPEILFSVQFVEADGGGYDKQEEGSIKPIYTAVRFIKVNGVITKVDGFGYGFDLPTQDLVDVFDPADPRLDVILQDGDSIYFDNPNPGSPAWYPVAFPPLMSTGYYCTKSTVNYDQFDAAQSNGKDIPVIRYADLLLIAAEASYKAGEGSPVDYVNKVRKRAAESNRLVKGFRTYEYLGDGTVPAPLASVDLQDIKNERRRELFLEGHRYFDLVRWGDADDILGNLVADPAGNAKSWNPATLGRMPIPQSQIIMHDGGNLIQNPGY